MKKIQLITLIFLGVVPYGFSVLTNTQAQNALQAVVDGDYAASNTYTKAEADAAFYPIADTNKFANASTTYTKTEVDATFYPISGTNEFASADQGDLADNSVQKGTQSGSLSFGASGSLAMSAGGNLSVLSTVGTERYGIYGSGGQAKLWADYTNLSSFATVEVDPDGYIQLRSISGILGYFSATTNWISHRLTVPAAITDDQVVNKGQTDAAYAPLSIATNPNIPSDTEVYASRSDLGVVDLGSTANIWDFSTLDMWLCGETYGTNMVDFSRAKTNSASYANVPCLVLDDVADYLDIPALTNGATIVSYSGTATLSPTSSNRVYASVAGTVSDLLLSDGAYFPMEENSGVTCYDVGGSGTNITIHADGSSIATVRNATADKVPWMATHGGSQVVRLDGDGVIQSAALRSSIPSCDRIDVSLIVRTNGFDQVICPALTNTFAVYVHSGGSIRYSDSYNGLTYTAATPLVGDQISLSFRRNVDAVDSVYVDGVLVTPTLSAFSFGISSTQILIGDRATPPSIRAFFGDILSCEYEGLFSYDFRVGLKDLSANNNDATLLYGADLYQYPALSSGTDDVVGLGITNPPDLAHNGGLYDLDIPAITNTPITYVELITGAHSGVGIETNSYYQVEEIYHVK